MRPRILRAAIGLLLPLGFAACHSEETSFLTRNEQDCHAGDQQACRMLEALHGGGVIAPGLAPLDRPAVMTQVQRDVAAILQGMRSARGFTTEAETPQPASPTP